MDLSGHRRYQSLSPVAGQDVPSADMRTHVSATDMRSQVGEALLATAYAALASARAEAVDLHLQGGRVIENVIGVRLIGGLAEAAIRRGEWTHAFCVADLVMVRQIPRGGRRS